ncbi:Endoplasmic reticulum protein SC65, partial [Camelus dromedarius]
HLRQRRRRVGPGVVALRPRPGARRLPAALQVSLPAFRLSCPPGQLLHDFQSRLPYQYLHYAQFKRNPKHELTTKYLNYYRGLLDAAEEPLKDLEAQPYEAVFLWAVRLYNSGDPDPRSSGSSTIWQQGPARLTCLHSTQEAMLYHDQTAELLELLELLDFAHMYLQADDEMELEESELPMEPEELPLDAKFEGRATTRRASMLTGGRSRMPRVIDGAEAEPEPELA